MAEKEMLSFRLPTDLLTALKERAEADGETLSDTIRRAALVLLGVCPTCGAPTLGIDRFRMASIDSKDDNSTDPLGHSGA